MGADAKRKEARWKKFGGHVQTHHAQTHYADVTDVVAQNNEAAQDRVDSAEDSDATADAEEPGSMKVGGHSSSPGKARFICFIGERCSPRPQSRESVH